MTKMDQVLRQAFEAARDGKQSLIACGGGRSVIVAPAPDFDPSAVDPPILIAQDGKACTCGLDIAPPCPVHVPDRSRLLIEITSAMREKGMCGCISGEYPREVACILPFPCEVEGH